MNTVEVNILGKRLHIRSGDDEQYVQEVAKYVDEKMKEVHETFRGTASMDVAILAAMNIADDYFKTRGQNKALTEEMSGEVNGIIEFIDQTLNSTK